MPSALRCRIALRAVACLQAPPQLCYYRAHTQFYILASSIAGASFTTVRGEAASLSSPAGAGSALGSSLVVGFELPPSDEQQAFPISRAASRAVASPGLFGAVQPRRPQEWPATMLGSSGLLLFRVVLGQLNGRSVGFGSEIIRSSHI